MKIIAEVEIEADIIPCCKAGAYMSVNKVRDKEYYSATCNLCNRWGPKALTIEKAIDKWNKWRGSNRCEE